MLAVFLTMFAIVALAGFVVLYVAFPHRGHDVPRAGWLGDAMRQGVDRMPTLETEESAPLQNLHDVLRRRAS